MKYEVLFSLKCNENIFKTVVCCSRDWHLKAFTKFNCSIFRPILKIYFNVFQFLEFYDIVLS